MSEIIVYEPVNNKSELMVTPSAGQSEVKRIKRMPGGLKGKISISDDFDGPLDDLKDYM